MTAVESAIIEVTDELLEANPIIEGLQDYQRLNLKEATQREITALLDLYLRRRTYLQTSLDGLQALLSDGHPDLAVREISPAALEDLQENLDTIAAARARFASNAAVGLDPQPGVIEPK